MEFGCTEQILSIAAMTSVQSVFISHEGEKKPAESAKRRFAVEEGDHLTLLNVYQAFTTKGGQKSSWCRDHYLNFKSLSRAVSVRAQLKKYLERFTVDVEREKSRSQTATGESIRRCLTTGYFAHAARMQPDGSFRNISGDTVLWAHPSSVMFNRKADWVIFHEVVETGNKTFIRDVWQASNITSPHYHPILQARYVLFQHALTIRFHRDFRLRLYKKTGCWSMRQSFTKCASRYLIHLGGDRRLVSHV